tara:strand:- start:9 stop:353 length:345 start_codon:yes stop_codon:yes gene_type:complete
MTWKDTLRKAPFNIGDAQHRRHDELHQQRQKLMKEFPEILEDFLDDELQEKIRYNPSAGSYTIHVQEVADAIKNLKNNGIKEIDIVQLLKKEYNAKRVEIDADGSIKFDGVITL